MQKIIILYKVIKQQNIIEGNSTILDRICWLKSKNAKPYSDQLLPSTSWAYGGKLHVGYASYDAASWDFSPHNSLPIQPYPSLPTPCPERGAPLSLLYSSPISLPRVDFPCQLSRACYSGLISLTSQHLPAFCCGFNVWKF